MFIGEFAATGWVACPPLSELGYSPAVGVDYYIWPLQISGLGTTLTRINFIVTILRMRAPGLTLMKMPMFARIALITNILIVAVFRVLTGTLALLAADRYLGTHFFTNELGGNAMMYINLIWVWGHPEVYILILPCFGAFSEIISTFPGKPLFGYKSMVYATASIGILSFFVWLHHLFTRSSGADVNEFFGIMTSMISNPTGVKLFNWVFTMFRGRIRYHTSTSWTIGFMVTFAVGGMTGVLLAVPGADFVLHKSLLIVAHVHNVTIGGVVFGCFAGISFWFPKVFGVTLDEFWRKVSF
jgi:cytochrome o ubiquinol oxidase subunit I